MEKRLHVAGALNFFPERKYDGAYERVTRKAEEQNSRKQSSTISSGVNLFFCGNTECPKDRGSAYSISMTHTSLIVVQSFAEKGEQ